VTGHIHDHRILTVDRNEHTRRSASRRRRALLSAIGALLMCGCNPLPLSVSCDGIRQLRHGMTEEEVRVLLGEPLSIIPVHIPASPPTPPYDVTWDYTNVPTVLVLRLNFWQRRLTAAVARREMWVRETLFIVDERHTVEAPRFSQVFCHP